MTQLRTSTIQTFEGQQGESYIRAHRLSLKVADSYSVLLISTLAEITQNKATIVERED